MEKNLDCQGCCLVVARDYRYTQDSTMDYRQGSGMEAYALVVSYLLLDTDRSLTSLCLSIRDPRSVGEQHTTLSTLENNG
jgi:hypothetical protein